MRIKWLQRVTMLLLVLWLLSACGSSGGGGGSGDSDDTADNGGGGTAVTAITDVSRGAIDAIASITMNGKTYQADDSTPVEGDDNPSFSDLQEGKVVTVEGGINNETGLLTAINIKLEEAVQGPVTQELMENQLMVLHQTVMITDQTIVDHNTVLDNLAPGDLVEVYGNVLAGGVIEATFIEAKLPATLQTWKVKGIIDSVTADVFTIGGLSVDTSSADLTDLPDGPQVGQLVEVKATAAGAFDATTLVADTVESDALEVEDDIELEVEGIVTSVNTVDTFFVPGVAFNIGAQQVETSVNTVFLGGLPEDLAVGVKVEVEGVSLNNIVQAENVKFKESIRIEGNLVATNDDNVFTIEGLSNIEVEINAFTEIADGELPNNGDHVRVRGREVTSGSVNRRVLASRIEVRDPDDDVELQAVVEVEDEPPGSENITIFGILIDTSDFEAAAGDDGSDFKGIDDANLTRAQFFAAVEVGQTIVQAKGRLGEDGIAWREVEIEGEDD